MTRFDREILPGFVSPSTFLTPAGLELLTLTGTVLILPYQDIKTVVFVRDFEQGEPRKELRSFAARPKLAGLWIRLYFRDGDSLEGVLPNNLLLLDGAGFHIVPPDPGFQNQRLFVPSAALNRVEVLGVIGSPLRAPRRKPPGKDQIDLFDGT